MRNMCCLSGLACIVSLFLLSSTASAFQMTFDVQGFVQNQIVGPTIEEDNIHLTSSDKYYASASFHGNPGFGMLPTSTPRLITVTLIGGAEFDFVSIDYNEMNLPSLRSKSYLRVRKPVEARLSIPSHQMGPLTITRQWYLREISRI
ncbi:MAG: hypothetical protein GTO51_05080 [Candidatus Latescibacteria bacterium]|nr:hypothetical protein [Candidatus Latescibacterota bacterium]